MSSARSAANSPPSRAKKSTALPPETVEYLKAWMMSPEHVAHPYPTEQEKADIMAETGIELKQLTNWFVNNRKRYWKPRVEAKLSKRASNAGPGKARRGSGLGVSARRAGPPKAGGSAAFPVLPTHAAFGGPASPHDESPRRAHIVPLLDDQHIVSSSSSSSSACSSGDEESLGGTSSRSRRGSFGTFAIPTLHGKPAPTLASHPIPAVGLSQPASTLNGYQRHEEVDVHVLRPDRTPEGEEPLPTLRDLTIKGSVSEERILATFRAPLAYTVPYEIEGDRKKVQSRRDGEVLRVKKHYLKLYLATRGIHSASSPLDNGNGSAVTEASAPAPTLQPVDATSASVAPLQKRRAISAIEEEEEPQKPRKRLRSASGGFLEGEDEWRALCLTARSVHCRTLPGIEEAARMFGYVS
ncbi:hypothetical protein ACHAXT_002152 [Thalassiosira profunda]